MGRDEVGLPNRRFRTVSKSANHSLKHATAFDEVTRLIFNFLKLLTSVVQ